MNAVFVAFSAVVLLSPAAPSTAAQTNAYPSRPVRVVVPSSPGGGLDLIARMTAPQLTSRWHQQVVVDNRAGAAGIIGTEIVAKAPPDGHTLLVAATDFAISPSLYEKLPYSTPQDFAPVTILATSPFVLIASPSVPAKSVKDLLALSKERGGRLSYASSGVGTTSHLSMAILQRQLGADIVHVPYKGAGAATAAVVTGEVQFAMNGTGATVPFIKAGKVRPIAITSSQRLATLPDVPTVAESGVAGYEATVWIALIAPGKTPRPVIDKIYRDVLDVMKQPEYAAQLRSTGNEPGGLTPADFSRFVAAEMQKYQNVIKQTGIRIEQ